MKDYSNFSLSFLITYILPKPFLVHVVMLSITRTPLEKYAEILSVPLLAILHLSYVVCGPALKVRRIDQSMSKV